jgi:hypothetical protein
MFQKSVNFGSSKPSYFSQVKILSEIIFFIINFVYRKKIFFFWLFPGRLCECVHGILATEAVGPQDVSTHSAANRSWRLEDDEMSSLFVIFFSVADPGCLSWIPDPDFYPSRISDPGSKNNNKR